MIASKISEERKKASEENLKLNVEYMVEDLIRKHPKRARTVLIKEDDNDSTTSVGEVVENIQYESSV
jgi:hypothetical protein